MRNRYACARIVGGAGFGCRLDARDDGRLLVLDVCSGHYTVPDALAQFPSGPSTGSGEPRGAFLGDQHTGSMEILPSP